MAAPTDSTVSLELLVRNLALGHAGDNSQTLRALADYVDRFNGQFDPPEVE